MIPQKINLLGGTGFVGMHLLQDLVKHQEVKTSVLSHQRMVGADNAKKCEVIRGSILDKGSLENFIEPHSTVINVSNIGTGSFHDNSVGANNLASVCASKKIKRLIHCSTAVVVGKTEQFLVNEETECLPSTNYEKNKLLFENILLDRLNDTVEIVILRPTAVFGSHGQNLIKLSAEVLYKHKMHLLAKTSINYKRRMNLIWVENLVAAFTFFIHSTASYYRQRFIVSEDHIEENNYFDVVNLLCKHFGKRPIEALKIPFRDNLTRAALRIRGRSNINIQRTYSAQKIFNNGYRPPIEFKEGIEKFAKWYVKSYNPEISGP